MKILVNFLILFLSNCEIVLNELQEKFENLQRELNEDPAKSREIQCHQRFLNTFGFAGYQFGQERNSSLCPYVHQNCCTPQDERVSQLKWTESGEIILGRRYSVYIQTLEYLLGFEKEAQFLMNDLLSSDEFQCRKSAIKYKNFRFNGPLLTGVLSVIKNSTKKVTEIRRGTYCSICDANTSFQLQNFWNQQDQETSSRIFYSQHFCKSLVAETIQSAYFTTSYVKNFLESFSEMISCKANNSTTIEYELPKEEIQQTRNCMFFQDKSFFFFCEKYCENFNLTQFSPVFDGYLEQLKQFVKHIARYRNEFFYYPDKNAYLQSVQNTEEFLLNQSSKIAKDQIFVQSKVFNMQVDQLKSDFIYKGGIDISDSYKNSGFNIQHMRAKLVNLVMITLSFILFQLLY